MADQSNFPNLPGLLTLNEVSGYGQTFHILSDHYGYQYLTREQTLWIIEELKKSMEYVSNEDIAHVQEQSIESHKAMLRAEAQYHSSPPRKPKKSKNGFVYIAKADRYHKIGMSKKPIQRISMFDVQSPFNVEIILLIESDNMEKTEAELHKLFSHRHVRGEWFDLSSDEIDFIAGQYQTVDLSTITSGRYSNFLATKGDA